MSHVLTVQTEETKLPILFLYTNTSPLLNRMLEEFCAFSRVILVSDQSISELFRQQVYHLRSDSAYLVSKLEDHIDYALVFLENSKDKKITEYLIDKAKADHCKVTVIIPIDRVEEFSDFIQSYTHEKLVQFFFLGDIFDPEEDSFSNEVAKITRNALTKKQIILSGNDLFPIYPISVTDFFTGIQAALFGDHGKESLAYLFYHHPQTIITAIHLLKRIEPELSLEYEQDSTKPHDRKTGEELDEFFMQTLGQRPVFLDEYFLGYEKSITTKSERKTESIIDESMQKKPSVIKKALVKKGGKGIQIYVAGLIVYIIFNLLLLFVGIVSAKQAMSSLEKGQYEKAATQIQRTTSSLQLTFPFINAISFVLSPLDLNSFINSQRQTLVSLENILNTTQLLLVGRSQISLFNPPDLPTLNTYLADILYLYFQTSEVSSQTHIPRLAQFFGQYSNFLSILQVAPEILGYKGDKTYLLLFQNNAELRPTGGFIGSVGELTLSKGKIEDLTIQDVYNVDGQLKTHVEPYFIIRRYLQPNLYLRDSNFNPDFQDTASSAASLYKLSTGKEVDGVISLDFDVLERIIEAIGPIQLTDYNTTLNKTNALSFIQNTVETDFFPGSTRKKDLLSQIMDQVMTKLKEDTSAQYKVLALFPTLLQEKHIMVAFRDANVQKIFTLLDFGGSLLDTRQKDTNNVYDTLSINEANIGVNKANASVTRRITDDVYLTNNNQESHITIELANTNQTLTYKTYLRVLVPSGSELESITFDGAAQTIVPAVTDFSKYEAKGFKPPAGLEVDTSSIDSLSAFGFITTVNPHTVRTIEVVYKHALPTFSSLFTYSLLYFKQPGTDAYPFQISVHYPDAFKPGTISNATNETGRITITQQLDNDQDFEIPFTGINQ